MAVRVVDLLEAVQVDEHGGEARVAPPRALDRLLEGGYQARAVGEAGERVVEGERGDVLAREHQVGDVAADAAVAEEAPVGREVRPAAHRVVTRTTLRSWAAELKLADRLVRVD